MGMMPTEVRTHFLLQFSDSNVVFPQVVVFTHLATFGKLSRLTLKGPTVTAQ